MPYTQQTSDFWGWYLRHNNRTVWSHLQDAGLDLFTAGPSSNTQAFLQLTNLLPAVSGGFSRRWGTTTLATNTVGSVPNILRTFLYDAPADNSVGFGATNTNLWIGTDNQNFFVYTDSGVPYTHYGPTNFSALVNDVSACVSRGWFYYAGGQTLVPALGTGAYIRKVNPSYTSVNTDSLSGIALPVQEQPLVLSPGGGGSVRNYFQDYQLYPSVWQISGNGSGTLAQFQATPTEGVTSVAITTAGSGQTQGTYTASGTGGGGSGAEIQYQIGSGGGLFSVTVLNSGTGYTSAPTFTIAAGGTPGTVTASIAALSVGYAYSGVGYKNTDTVSIIDPTGSGGTGATGTLVLDSAGRITGFNITAPGSGYGAANASISTSTGTGGSIVLYVRQSDRDGSGNLKGTGPVTGWDLGGPMSFAAGRQYAVALQNSSTGHTSDVFIANAVLGPKSGTGLDALTSVNSSLLIPIVSSTNATAGFSGLSVAVSVPYKDHFGAGLLDSQVDTVLLLAAADGEGLSVLYEVQITPLADFALLADPGGGGQFYQLWILDTLPDSYNATTTSGNTLLEQDIWSEIDSAGDINGISLNTPPPVNLKYILTHQGRMFGTDGKTIFYSKSLDEVTTSTGLITAKWEEAWPGDYQLPVALNNEEIIGMKSDGTNLHAGTEKSIFTVYGSDPSNFSVPSTAFAETGILSNDLWAVIYAEGQPSGFVWVTQDFKVMHSDFSTYHEIGTPIYPILKTLNPTYLEQAKIWSLTQGPYNLVFIHFYIGTTPTLLVWDSRLGKWLEWTYPTADVSGNYSVGVPFVYQVPSYSASGRTAGTKNLFYWTENFSPTQLIVNYFDPTANSDRGTAIGWTVQPSWQDLGDPTSIKTINEMELVGDDAPFNVSLYGATSQSQFESGGTLLKSAQSVTGPISALATNKFYCAGAPTSAKFYTAVITPVTPGTGSLPLTSFSMESYPMARI